MTGITYRGKHSARDIGVTVRTVTRPLMPPPRITEETIPYKDGSVDYSDIGGRLFYDDKVVEVEISVTARGLAELHSKISKVAVWLAGGFDKLIFDDMPYTVWVAKPVNVGGIAPQLQKVGKTTVQFRAHPYNELLFDTLGIPLGSRIPLGSKIPIGYGNSNIVTLTPGENIIEHNYIGNAPVRAALRITGGADGVTIHNAAQPDKVISYQYQFEELFINSDDCTCTADGVDTNEKMNGDYRALELVPGINNITLMLTGAGGAQLQFEYNSKYFYKDEGFCDD